MKIFNNGGYNPVVVMSWKECAFILALVPQKELVKIVHDQTGIRDADMLTVSKLIDVLFIELEEQL